MVLPDALWLCVFRFLSIRTLARAAQVCKHWKTLVDNDLLWQPLFKDFLQHGHLGKFFQGVEFIFAEKDRPRDKIKRIVTIRNNFLQQNVLQDVRIRNLTFKEDKRGNVLILCAPDKIAHSKPGLKIVFERCEIGSIHAESVQVGNKLEFVECHMGNAFFFATYFLEGLRVSRCTFSGAVDFSCGGHNDNGEFILEDSFFEGFVDYFDALFKQVVIFRNVDFAGGCNFEAEGRGVQPPAYNEYVKENVTGCLTQTAAHG